MNDLRGKIIKELDEFNIDADDEFLDYGVEYEFYRKKCY